MDAERTPGIDPTAAPSGEGCADCLASEAPGWWFHLRRCAACGRIGCCDSSPSQHASRHARESGHPVLTSFEPGEDWFWNAETQEFLDGPAMSPPTAHPDAQPVPGPAGKVPPDWQQHLN
ncbi:UBP-type zinc finger domain-containing protein [Streptomyces aculeolatus]|uniref:UBP-type zinc finger domain-containing protein n=1 Tax=Streptomyces aculeolatus TaxID=270689 RepID=UPI00037A12E9|nr:UBP-type zinc finger domain-containing protein [Streptomyces aculeolatus]